MDKVFEDVERISKRLLAKPTESPKGITLKGGVYLIRRNNKIIYVGKAVNLHRRINSDHISGEIKNSTSTVRRKISKNYGILHGQKMREWMSECKFSTFEIEEPSLRGLVEDYLIYKLKNEGNSLLNS